MALHSVLLPMILAVSLATTECCASSPGSRMDLHLHSQKNASGHWIIRVKAQRSLVTDNEREIIIDAHERTKLTANNELEQVVTMTTVYPPLHDISKPGAIEPATTTPTTATSSTSTTTTATPPTNTTTTSTTSPRSCPPGYQPHPGLNCYKAFHSDGERKTWSQARATCMGDGGDLMVIETERERKEVFIPLLNSVIFHGYPWMGVYIPQGGNDWTTVKGQPALSTWWYPGEPEKDAAYKCAYAIYTGQLGNHNCEATRTFICEISLLEAHQHPERRDHEEFACISFKFNKDSL